MALQEEVVAQRLRQDVEEVALLLLLRGRGASRVAVLLYLKFKLRDADGDVLQRLNGGAGGALSSRTGDLPA